MDSAVIPQRRLLKSLLASLYWRLTLPGSSLCWRRSAGESLLLPEWSVRQSVCAADSTPTAVCECCESLRWGLQATAVCVWTVSSASPSTAVFRSLSLPSANRRIYLDTIFRSF